MINKDSASGYKTARAGSDLPARAGLLGNDSGYFTNGIVRG